MIPIAGVPLVLRQLQWLHSTGIRDITVEIGTGPVDMELRALLQGDVFGRQARIIQRPEPSGPRRLAEIANVELPALALADDSVGDGDLAELVRRSNGSACVFTLTAPSLDGEPRPLESATVEVLAPDGDTPSPRQGLGWGARIRDFEHARVLGRAVLLGHLPQEDDEHRWPIIVHAREMEPGVWVARGGSISPRADVVPPILVGADAVIVQGAHIGPDAFIGRGSTIARDAHVRASFVAPATLVGEGVRLEEVVAYPDRMHALHDPNKQELIDDARVLTTCNTAAASTRVSLLITSVLLLSFAGAIAWLVVRYL